MAFNNSGKKNKKQKTKNKTKTNPKNHPSRMLQVLNQLL